MAANNPAETESPPAAESAVNAESPRAVLLICVKYGADKETALYLESLRSLNRQQSLQVLVVDNASEGGAERWPEWPNCSKLSAPDNLGYFGGARYGLSLYLQSNPLPDWIIISNVDLMIADTKFLEHLSELGSVPRLGAVAPSIRSGLTGRDQNPYMRVRPSPVRMHLYKWLFRNWLVLNAYELASAAFHKVRTAARRLGGRDVESRQSSRSTIYAPHGSFLILSKSYFARGGDLQFPGFLFGEEIYLAECLKRLELEVVYEPSLQVIHEEHRSTKLFKSRKLAGYVASSAAYCADTFFPLHFNS